MSDPTAMPVMPLNYATSDGIPAHVLARVVVWAVTISSAASVLGSLISSVGWLVIQGIGSSAAYILYSWVPVLAGNIPVLVVGILSLLRGRHGPAMVVVLWIEVIVRALVPLVMFAIYLAYQGLSLFTDSGTRYSVISSFGNVFSTFASLVLPLLAIWILRRPEVRRT